MRLICPNCDAQYEVPDDVIPAAGRDVQCSSCGNTWFFQPVDDRDHAADAAEAEIAEAVQPAPEPAPEVAPGDIPSDRPATAAPEPGPGAEPPAAEGADDAPVPHEDTPMPRRRLDPEIANVLREEAEYEARAREAERSTLETQPELGLSQSEGPDAAARRRAAEARARMARLAGESIPGPDGSPIPISATEPVGVPAAAAAAGNSRRGMLPDVEDINATLTSESDRPRPQDTEAPNREPLPEPKGRGRTGFVTMLALAALGLCGYVFAPQITEAVPGLEAPMAAYVGAVDTARAWLDGQVLEALAMFDAAFAEDSAAPQDGG
jgi:predicted Zn finger-like uncharacterized protein